MNLSTLFGDFLHDSKIAELQRIRDDIKPTLDNNILAHFTDHSVKHSDRMVKLLRDVILENLESKGKHKLCESEIFILLLSLYLHDIGMQIPIAHGIDKSINEFTDEDYNKIRKNHGEISAEIVDEISKTGKTYCGISLNLTKAILKDNINIVCEIISKHQSNKEYNPNERIKLSGEDIRIGVIIALLRIVDTLDCSHERVNIEILHQYTIPKISIMHWIACHYIDSISVENGSINIIGSSPDSFPPNYIEFLNKELIEKINSELFYENDNITTKEVLWENNIKINFNNKISKQEGKYSTSRWSLLPDWVSDKIKDNVTFGPPKFTQRKKDNNIEKQDWMSYWGFIGNPFLDYPLDFGSERLVETKSVINILSEIDSVSKSGKGDVKLLIGERGLGKTTIFQLIKGKFKDKFSVDIIDAADIATTVNTSTELYSKLFKKANDVFGYEEDFNKDNFLDKVIRSNFRVICIDSLDRLPPEKSKILDGFFKQAQHVLSLIKGRGKLFFIMSCSDEWEKLIDSDELSYLGKRNQWILNKFSTNESKKMLEKRLVTSGKSLTKIFDDNCFVALHTLSNSNPREILINAENACRLAYNQKKVKIDLSFIETEYKGNLEEAYDEFLKKKCSSNTKFKDGLIAIYWYFIDIDRRNLDRNLGVDILTQMAENEVRKDPNIFQYSVAMGYVSNQSLKQDGSSYIEFFKIKEVVKKLFTILRRNGYIIKDFLSFYSLKPYIPKGYRDSLKEPVNVMDKSSEHFYYYEKSRRDYLDIVKGDVTYAYNIYKKSWDVIEYMLVAILIKINKLNPQDYESMKQDLFYTDKRYGVERYKYNANELLINQSYQIVKKFMNANKQKRIGFIYNLNSMFWILRTRKQILLARTKYIQEYSNEDQCSLCIEHLKLIFKEIEQIYRKTKDETYT